MLFAPFFGSSAIPARVKAGLVMALTLLLFPVVGQHIGPYSLIDWPIVVFREFLLGAGMGIATNLVFDAALLAGQIVGMQMGYSLVNLLDPQTQVDTTVMAVFYQSFVMLIFLQLDVHYWLLRAIGDSFLYLPPSAGHLSGLFYAGSFEYMWPRIRSRRSDRSAGTGGHTGHRYSAWSARESLHATAADAARPAVKMLLGMSILIATMKYCRISPQPISEHVGERHPRSPYGAVSNYG